MALAASPTWSSTPAWRARCSTSSGRRRQRLAAVAALLRRGDGRRGRRRREASCPRTTSRVGQRSRASHPQPAGAMPRRRHGRRPDGWLASPRLVSASLPAQRRAASTGCSPSGATWRAICCSPWPREGRAARPDCSTSSREAAVEPRSATRRLRQPPGCVGRRARRLRQPRPGRRHPAARLAADARPPIGRLGTDAPADEAKQRLEATVRGDVQGVGFRWFVAGEAAQPLSGWVANQSDGSVQVVAEGRRRLGLVEALQPGRRGRSCDRCAIAGRPTALQATSIFARAATAAISVRPSAR